MSRTSVSQVSPASANDASVESVSNVTRPVPDASVVMSSGVRSGASRMGRYPHGRSMVDPRTRANLLDVLVPLGLALGLLLLGAEAGCSSSRGSKGAQGEAASVPMPAVRVKQPVPPSRYR